MSQALGFELLVLRSMCDSYVHHIFNTIGIDNTEAENIIRSSGLEKTHIASMTIDAYRQMIGLEIDSKHIDIKENNKLAGSKAYYFLLNLWPDLLWVVHETQSGMCWEVGFQNQINLSCIDLQPRLIRNGVWTLHSLQQLADNSEFHDGWDEKISVKFAFGNDLYFGDFAFGLLQNWYR